MRKITVLSMISLDGVMQAPGAPGEDTSGNFKYGGWVATYGDELLNRIVSKELEPADYLLGRKTFDIFAAYWPDHHDFWPAINEGTKYVLSRTMEESDWKNSSFLKNIEDIRKVKQTQGADIQVWGSSELVHLLLQHDLVDEIRLKIYPLILGEGKRLFDQNAVPGAFVLQESQITSNGVIIAHYKRGGEIITGEIKI